MEKYYSKLENKLFTEQELIDIALESDNLTSDNLDNEIENLINDLELELINENI